MSSSSNSSDPGKPPLLECGGLPPLSTKNVAPSTPPSGPESKTTWPHAPTHRLAEAGTYLVTAGTYGKARFFTDGPLLRMLHQALLQIAAAHGWQLEAWAVFPNHYHFIAHSPPQAGTLVTFLRELHSRTAIALNCNASAPGRKVWHNYWDSRLTHERSYLARLNYVHQNPVKHGLVAVASQYRYCSAAWFERTATASQIKTIYAFKTDRLNVQDDF
jgi:putative transposase